MGSDQFKIDVQRSLALHEAWIVDLHESLRQMTNTVTKLVENQVYLQERWDETRIQIREGFDRTQRNIDATQRQIDAPVAWPPERISSCVPESSRCRIGKRQRVKPFARLVNKAAQVQTINESIETPDKANAFFVGNYNFEFRDDNSDYPAMVMGNFMLGGGFLNSRLATRIRQKEGLSYGVGSQFSAGSLDPVGSFFAYAIYAPENVEKLEAAFKDEINKDKWTTVQFNPDSLKVTFANQVAQPQGGGDQNGPQAVEACLRPGGARRHAEKRGRDGHEKVRTYQ